MSESIQWPAFIQYTNSDELEIVENDTDLKNLSLQKTTDLRLVDYNGLIYAFSDEANSAALTQTQLSLSVEEAVQIVRKHMAAQEQCCVSKFNARTIVEVIDALVASGDD